MNEEFRQVLIETIQELKDYDDLPHGVVFRIHFEEEPEWEVSLTFKKLNLDVKH